MIGFPSIVLLLITSNCYARIWPGGLSFPNGKIEIHVNFTCDILSFQKPDVIYGVHDALTTGPDNILTYNMAKGEVELNEAQVIYGSHILNIFGGAVYPYVSLTHYCTENGDEIRVCFALPFKLNIGPLRLFAKVYEIGNLDVNHKKLGECAPWDMLQLRGHEIVDGEG